MGRLYRLALFAAILTLSGSALANAPFKAQPVSLPHTYSALHIKHLSHNFSGGFSALYVSPDCSSLITISDYSQAKPRNPKHMLRRSGWYQTELAFNDQHQLIDLKVTDSGQLRGLDGKKLSGETESMEWDGQGFLVAFDNHGDIYRYAGKSPEGKLLNNKPMVAYAQSNLGKGNEGLEAMTVLKSGEVISIWETLKGAKTAQGRVLNEKGIVKTFSYAALRIPSGATTLSDGGVLVLEKQWLGPGKGQQMALVRLSPESLNGPAKHIEGEVLLDVQSHQYDNIEGVGVCNRGGREWAMVITDDNGDWILPSGKKRQRTLLMQFDLTPLRAKLELQTSLPP